jgi:hypothetical protein
MVEENGLPVFLPMPPNAAVKLTPPVAPSFQIRLPPARLPGHAYGGGLATISPQKRDRTNYPLGLFTTKRPKVHRGSEARLATERGEPEEEILVKDEPLSYSEYLEFIQSGAIGFFKLHTDIYVVQGWDGKRAVAKVRMMFMAH